MNTEMSSQTLFSFFSGAAMMAFLAVALFFFKYFRKSGDALFLLFSFGFLVLGLERFVTSNYFIPEAHIPLVYLFRFFAFGLIGAGILRKNLVAHRKS